MALTVLIQRQEDCGRMSRDDGKSWLTFQANDCLVVPRNST